MCNGPRLTGVLETCLYCSSAEQQDIVRFYSETLGLPQVAGWGDGTAFRAGAGVLLLFDRERLAKRDGPIAAHGTSGPGHCCLVAPADEYEDWKRRLGDGGVEITHEERWTSGHRSFYFEDPAGNLLEIADGDLWPVK